MWPLALAAATGPLLVLGWTASALANRLVFVGWALLAASVSAGVLRWAWGCGWSRAGIVGATLVAAGASLLLFAGLVARHQVELDLGYRAIWWPFYRPLLARPQLWVVAGGLATVAGALGLIGRRR